MPLLDQYLAFYGIADRDVEKYQRFFSRFGPSSREGCQFLFRVDGRAVAFATVFFTHVTSIAARVAVMNDLFTEPEYRGMGIGRQLVDHCLGYAREQGAARLQWLTGENNTRAQALYDSTGARSSLYRVYILD